MRFYPNSAAAQAGSSGQCQGQGSALEPIPVAAPQLHSRDRQDEVQAPICHIVGGVVLRLFGAGLVEQMDEWLVGHRSFSLGSMATLLAPGEEPGKEVGDATVTVA